MLAVHELEEIEIGDLTQFEVSKEDKQKMGHEAIETILSGLLNQDQIRDLVLEFDERKTKEAIFAYQCDKLECDLQCKLYDCEGCVSLDHQEKNQILHDPRVKALFDDGNSWSDMWILFDQNTCDYDDHFMEVSNYIRKHRIDKYK